MYIHIHVNVDSARTHAQKSLMLMDLKECHQFDADTLCACNASGILKT